MRLLNPASVKFASSVTNPSVSILLFDISFFLFFFFPKWTAKIVKRELKFLSVKNWVVFEKTIKKYFLGW